MLGGIELKQWMDWAAGLGARRLALLGLIAATGVATFAAIAFFATRPNQETLYTNIAPLDMARMSQTLSEVGMPFDIGSDGSKISVKRGDASRARALLAERGLPASAGVGYELFDKLGPLGLTTFMQEVTRVRALEGELARTIQAMKGVRSARVHIVLPEPGTFRRQGRSPSASVVIKTEQARDATSVPAIRHLVAAAVPGLTTAHVRVLNTDGSVFTQEDDTGLAAPARIMDLERRLSQSYQDSIRRTLAPHIGLDNLEVSVAVRINIDRRQVNETRYDPSTRVERSVRNVRETGTSQNASGRPNVSVEQNIPADKAGFPAGDQSQKSNLRREELTNYEVGSSSTATVSEGYRIENLTVAALVNRKQLVEMLGGAADDAALSKRLAELERIIALSVGLDGARGDKITVSALDFAGLPSGEQSGSLSLLDVLVGHLGVAINGFVVLVAIALVVLFGLRPAVRALEQARPALAGPSAGMSRGGTEGGIAQVTESPGDGGFPEQIAGLMEALPSGSLPVEARLEQLISTDAEKAAAVLRRWVREGTPS